MPFFLRTVFSTLILTALVKVNGAPYTGGLVSRATAPRDNGTFIPCQQLSVTVMAGMSCTSLLAQQQQPNLDIEKFLQLNHDVNDNCTNLIPGRSYCIAARSKLLPHPFDMSSMTELGNISATECGAVDRAGVGQVCSDLANRNNITVFAFNLMNPAGCSNFTTGEAYCVTPTNSSSLVDSAFLTSDTTSTADSAAISSQVSTSSAPTPSTSA
ncbi:hypothetical protein C8R46DRAFT_442891 [Mycena filopes]|nr:hypothetical protein C8R46DRAFT_442891 [Mycena filopes]